jgi:uncharacterized membrane protein YphA (DoxX/SURF4 family)
VVLTGIADRFAAFVLAGYCGVTALLWKQFWKPGDFSPVSPALPPRENSGSCRGH